MASVEQRGDGRTVQLKAVRLAFTTSLKEAKATVEDGKPKHTCSILLEKDSPNFKVNNEKVLKAIAAACEKEWKNPLKWKDIQEDNPKRIAYRKGERSKNKDGEVYEGFANTLALSVAGPSGGKFRPKMLNRHKQEVGEDDILSVVYSGTYADVVVSLYATDKGGPGVFASVEAIRSHQRGDSLGGGVQVDADDFVDLDDDDLLNDDLNDSDDDLL